jgi:hypothetical protein
MGLNQHVVDRTGRQINFLGQGSDTPTALELRLLADFLLYLLPGFRPMLGRAARTRAVLESFQATGGKGSPPLADGDGRHLQAGGNLLIGIAGGRSANTIWLRATKACGVDGDRTRD